MLRKYLVYVTLEDKFDEIGADLNDDGKLDILDLVRLRKILAGNTASGT